MGLDLKGRYLAHALARDDSISNVYFMLHKWYLWRGNGPTRQRTLSFTAKVRSRHQNSIYVTRTGIHPVFTGEWRPNDNSEYIPPYDGHISNLIVTVPAGYVIQALEPIAHQLDHKSTICLIHDALGVAQDVAEKLFPDETRRPTIVLGHVASTLGHLPEQEELIKAGHLGVDVLKKRELLLTFPFPEMYSKGVPRGPRLTYYPRKHKVLRNTYFFRLMEGVSGLRATDCKFENFLRDYKLKMIALRAVADPVATLLDITYDKFEEHHYAQRLVEILLGEMCDVISRLPECRVGWERRFTRANVLGMLRHELFLLIKKQGTADNRLRFQTARGWMTDINYTTGFLVRKGRELGAKVDALETVMLAVKAKQLVSLKRQDDCIPFDEYYKRQPDGSPLVPGSSHLEAEPSQVVEEAEHRVEEKVARVEKSEVIVPGTQDAQEARAQPVDAEERKAEQHAVVETEVIQDGVHV